MDEAVDTDGHDLSFMNTLNHHIASWLEGTYNDTNIIYNMSDEEIKYLLNHLQSSESDLVPTGHLTRIGRKYHASGLKEGDVLKGNNLFRSFSRDPSSTSHIISEYREYGMGVDDWVIYRTVGNVKFFDPTKFSNPYPDQTETFVPVDTMKVTKIHTITDDDELYALTGIDQHIPNNRHIKVIDITPDENIKSVPVILNDGETTINL